LLSNSEQTAVKLFLLPGCHTLLSLLAVTLSCHIRNATNVSGIDLVVPGTGGRALHSYGNNARNSLINQGVFDWHLWLHLDTASETSNSPPPTSHLTMSTSTGAF
jgi:hypothetical protein